MNRLTRSLWNNLTGRPTAVAAAVAGMAPAARPRATPRPLALEPRLMFDAAAVTAAAEAAQHAEAPAPGAHAADAGHGAALADAAARLAQAGPAAVAHEQDRSTTRHDLVFIDTGVTGWEALRDGVAPGADVVLLDPARDGLTQMLAALQGRNGLDSIQVISHGVEGRVYLGSLTLDTATVSTRAADLAQLGSALAPGGDLLLFGCRVAGGTGQGFIDALAAATGADVAASTGNTGGAGPGGGDWALEASTGPIESRVALNEQARQAFAGHLALLLIDSGDDTFGGDDYTTQSLLIQDMADGGGLSLREAMYWANAGDTLRFDASLNGATISLSSSLSVGSNITFDSAPAGFLTINGSSLVITDTLTVNTTSGGRLTLAAQLDGANLAKTGAGTLMLTSNSNSYNTTLVREGDIDVTGDANLGFGAVTLNGGTLSVHGGASGSANIDNALVLGADHGTLNVYGGGGTFALNWSGAISGTGNLTKTAAAILQLSNSGNSYSGSTTVSGGKLSLGDDGNLGGGDVVVTNGSLVLTGNGVTIDNAVTLSASTTITNANAVTLSGAVTGSGGFTKAGAGTLTLSGSSNAVTGAMQVSAGTLAVGDGANLGSTSAVTVDSGATLALGFGSKTIGSLAGAGSVTIKATLNLGGDNTSTAFSGVISSTAANGINKQGTGTFTLSGANTYTGSTTVSAGTLALSGGSALSDSTAVNVADNATLSLLASETIGSLASTGTAAFVTLGSLTLTAGGSNTSTSFAGTLSGTGGFTKAGTGTLTLTGSNTYTGATTLSAGGLTVSGGFAIANNSAVTVASGATLTLSSSETIGSLAGAGTVDLGTRTLTAGGNNTTTTFSGVLGTTGNTGGFVKGGSGTFTLSGSTNNVASVQIQGGILSAASGGTAGSTALGAGTVSLNGGNLTLTGSGTIGNALTLMQSGTVTVAGARTLSGLISGSSNNQLTLEGGGSLTLSNAGNSASFAGGTRITDGMLAVAGDSNLGAGTLTLNGGILSVTGAGTIDNAINVSNPSTLDHSGALTLSGLLTGNSDLYKDGVGTLTLGNTGNSAGFSGGIRIRDGAVSAATGGALGSGTITLNGGNLSLTGATTVANNISVVLAGTISTSAAVTFSGVISNSDTLTLDGTGTATLSGTSTYSGDLTVNGGTALMTGSMADVNTVTVASGATLGGTGTLGGSGHGRVTVQAGGTIAPGLTGSTGVLTLGNGLTIAMGGTLQADINGPTAGTDFDQLDVTGTVDVTDATLSLQTGTLTAGNTYRVINNDASDAIVGTFSGLPEGSTLTANGGQLMRVFMSAGTGNDLVLRALGVPVIGALGGDTVGFSRGSGPVLLDAGNNATLTDANGGNFNGGNLTVSITGHRVPGEDVLSIRSQAFGISVSGSNVSYYSTVIGTFTGGTGSSDLVVSFNNQADAGNVQALLRTLTYNNTNTGAIDAAPRTVRVTVDNGQGGVSANANITVTVAGGNQAPTAGGIGTQTVEEKVPFNFTLPAGAFSDPDGNVLTYTATLQGGAPLPAWLHFDGATGGFSGIPQNGDVGSLSIRVTASDPDHATASADFTLTVKNTNDAPTAAPITAQAATQGTAFSLSLPASTFADVDVGDTLAWKATLADGSALPAWLSFDAATHRFSGTPGNADVGRLTVRVTATDSGNASASSDFTLAVANVNDAPTAASIAAQTAREGKAFSFTLPGSTFTDVDVGDKLTLTATLADGSTLPAWLRFDAASGSFSGTPAGANVGSLSVRVTATDIARASASSDFTLTVAAATVNHAPVASPIGAQAATEGGAFSFTLPGSTFTDVDAGDTLSLKATLANGSALPAWLSFDAATGRFSGTPAAANVGSLSVRVTATDAANTSASSDFTLTVAAAGHHAPVLATPSSITLVDTAGADSFSAVGGQLAATADAGSTLRYTIDGGSAGQVQIGGHAYDQQKTGAYGTLWLDSATGQYVYVPANGAVNAAAHAAQDVFGLSVSDGSLKAATALTVDIAGVDDRPQGGVALAGTAQVGQVLTATASLTDAEGLASTTLRWQAQAADGSWADVAGATGSSFTPGTAQAGQAVRVVARVTDAQGGVAEVSSTASATVQAAPVLPPVVLPPEVVNPVPPAPPPPLPAPSGPLIAVPSSPGDLGGIIFSEPLPGLPAPARVASNPLASNPASITVIGSTSPPMGSVLPNPAMETGLPSLIGVGDYAALMRVPSVLVSSPAMGMVLYNLPQYYLQAVSGVGVGMQLSAAQADGKPLPPWLSFDATKGEFKGTPPHGYKGTLHIELTVRDAQGHMTTTTLDVEVAPIDGGTDRDKVIKPQAAARTGLSEQLQAARRPALGERLNEKVAARATAPQTRT